MFSIALTREYLWRHVNLSPAVSNSRLLVINRPRQPKISNLAEIIIILGILLDEDILQFDISMDYILLMTKINSFTKQSKILNDMRSTKLEKIKPDYIEKFTYNQPLNKFL